MPRAASESQRFWRKRPEKLRVLQELHPYPTDVVRPETREDCMPCPTCQAFHDSLEPGTFMPPTARLACGHTTDEAPNHCRPCPFVSCENHLYLDVNDRNGTIKFTRPDIEPWEMKETCARDVAERGGEILGYIGDIFNVTRERIRQIENKALRFLQSKPSTRDFLRQIADQVAEQRRREDNAG